MENERVIFSQEIRPGMNYYGYMSGWPLVELDSPSPHEAPHKPDKTA